MPAWVSAAIDFLAKIGGLAAFLALVFQHLIKGWISDRFATKADLRKHEQDLVRQSEGARLQLRSLALQKLVEKRFESVDRMNAAAQELGRAVIDYAGILRVLGRMLDEAPTDNAREDLSRQARDATTALFNKSNSFNESLYSAQAYVPFALITKGFEIYSIAGHLHGSLTPETVVADAELASLHSFNAAIGEFHRGIRKCIERSPGLADLLSDSQGPVEGEGPSQQE